MRDNPLYQRWLRGLKGRELIRALVPTLLGAALVLWYFLDPASLALLSAAKGFKLLALAWLLFRGSELVLTLSKPSSGPELDSSPLSPWDVYWGAALPLMLEALPFAVAHAWHAERLHFITPPAALVYFPAVMSDFFGFLGLITVPVACLSHPGPRRLGAWLVLPSWAAAWYTVRLVSGWIGGALGFSSLDAIAGEGSIGVSAVMLGLSLTPLTLAIGPLIALIASGRILGRGYSRFVLDRAWRFALLAVCLLALGQAAAWGMRRVVPPLLEIQHHRIEPLGLLVSPDRNLISGPTRNGFVTRGQYKIRVYDTGLNLLREYDTPSVDYIWQSFCSELKDGTIRLYCAKEFAELAPDGGVTTHQLPPSLTPSRATPLIGYFAADGMPLHIEYIGNRHDILDVKKLDPLTGGERVRHRLQFDRDRDFSTLIATYSEWNDKFLALDRVTGKLAVLDMQDGSVEYRRLPNRSRYFFCTDLKPEFEPTYPFHGDLDMAPDGSLIYTERNWGPGPGEPCEIRVWVYPPGKAVPRCYSYVDDNLMGIWRSFVIGDRLVIGATWKSGVKDPLSSSTLSGTTGGVVTFALEDLGIKLKEAN